jgi:Ankyrin repeats (many copies)
MEAAKAGHLECLERMRQEGRLLSSDSQERKSAGEARRAELWDASLVGCKAGQAHALKWLFRDGWPASVDATSKHSLSGLAQPREGRSMEELYILGMNYRDEWFLAEVNLCRFALQTPDTACLEALLDAGCRSEWMCPMAALEGREAHLALAATRGYCCDARTLYVAAKAGNLTMLWAAHGNATVAMSLLDKATRDIVSGCLSAAAEAGSVECLRALLDWFECDRYFWSAMVAAIRAGHLDCLQELAR